MTRRLLVSHFLGNDDTPRAELIPVSKSLSIFGLLVCQLGTRVESLSDKYVSLLLDNANTGYAEVSSTSEMTRPELIPM